MCDYLWLTPISPQALNVLSQHSAVGAVYDSFERLPTPKCHPGTYEAVQARIFDWMKKDDHHRIFWLSGGPGVGKTALAQTIAERCAQEWRLAASFFFYRGKVDRSDGRQFFSTVAFQLTKSIPSLSSAILKVLGADPTILYQSNDNQLQKLIICPLYHVGPLSTSMVIVVDALDECADGALLCEIISLLAEALNDFRIPLQLFLTSRPEPYICDAFESIKIKTKVHSLSLDEPDTFHSIRVYLEHGFHDIFDSWWPQSGTLPDALVRLVNGSFIYAFTTLRFIDNAYDNGSPTDRLTTVLNLRAGINPLYERILSACNYDSHTETLIGTIILL